MLKTHLNCRRTASSAALVGVAMIVTATTGRAQQVVVEGADPTFHKVDIGIIRAQKFYEGFSIRASSTNAPQSGQEYKLASSPMMFGSGLTLASNQFQTGFYPGTFYLFSVPVDVRLKGDRSSVRSENDPNNYTQDFGIGFTPTNNGNPVGPSSFATVTAHVVSSALQFDGVDAVRALATQTIGFNETVTLSVGLTNSSTATGIAEAALTVDTNAYAGTQRGVDPYDEFQPSEVTITPPSGTDLSRPSTLQAGQSLSGYALKITPQRSNGSDVRFGSYGFRTDFDSSQAGDVSGGRTLGFAYYVPTTVTAGVAQHATGLGGSTQVAGVDATFPATTGGDFAVDFAPTQLPGTPNFTIAGSSLQEWTITYTDASGNPVVLGPGGAQLTFHYDPSTLGGVDESTLQIEHYLASMNRYERLTVLSRDTDADTITVLTNSFSPFVLATAVPEPGTLAAFAVAGGGMLLRRARRRTMGR